MENEKKILEVTKNGDEILAKVDINRDGDAFIEVKISIKEGLDELMSHGLSLVKSLFSKKKKEEEPSEEPKE